MPDLIPRTTNIQSNVGQQQSTIAYQDLLARLQAQNNVGGGNTKQSFGNVAGMIGGGIGSLMSAIPSADKNINENDQFTQGIRDQAINTLGSGAAGPWGVLASGILSVFDKTGGFTDSSQGLGKGADVANSIMALALPGAGYFTPKTDDYNRSQIVSNTTGYNGVIDSANTAAGNANAKLLFGRRKANEMIKTQKLKDRNIEDIMGNATDDFTSANNALFSTGVQTRLSGGVKPLRIGKEGFKIKHVDFTQKVLDLLRKTQKAESNGSTLKFQEGGAFNVIPEGALHAHKHNLSEIDEKYEVLTDKGIPVISEKEDGGIIQHAEVEHSEIILRLELTKKLEELAKDGSEEAMLEAGKLLTREIMENTIDKSGLMEQV